MKKQRRNHSESFKARVIMRAAKGIRMINEIIAEFEVHPVPVSAWKKKLLKHYQSGLNNELT